MESENIKPEGDNDNVVPGQQNYPTPTDLGNHNAQSGEQIIRGASQEDQLDSLKQNAAETGPGANEIGATPSTGDGEQHGED